MNKVFAVLFSLSFWCLAFSTLASGMETEHTVNTAAKAEVAFITTTSTSSHPVVAEKVTVDYKISVLGFFNGGTQFDLPSLSKARLSQSSSFAINGNEVIDGNTYATQIWQIDLIPEQAGFIEIPALIFSVKYKTEQGVQKQETILSDELALFSYLPKALKNFDNYIVSSDVNASDEWTGKKDSYEVGDVLTREITLTATDISSIQFPLLKLSSIDGIKINKQETKLSDSSNRGEQIATLQQTVHYTLLQAGHFEIPKEHLNWWSLDNGLQTVSLEAVSVNVAGFSRLMMMSTLLSFFVICFLLLFYFRFKNKPPSIKSQLLRALKKKQWHLFIGLLYRQLDTSESTNNKQSEVTLLKEDNSAGIVNQLLTYEYQRKGVSLSRANLTISALKKLIRR